jgi:hypothetical protein
MMLKLGRIAIVLTAALTFAAASIPSYAEAQGYGPAGGWGRGAWGGGGYWGGGGWNNVGWGGCGCQVWVPPPPPPCCAPPPCCVYGGGGDPIWRENGGWSGRGYGGGYYGY